ncbi:MAG: sulfatase [Opitutaceae bacterium]
MSPLNLARVFLAAICSIATTGCSVAEKPIRPNLLVIQTDEHNFRTLGAYRDLLSDDQSFMWGEGIKVETPNIDWLAQNGVIADRAYATTPVCTPSRAAMMTGHYPQNTGSIKNDRPMWDHMVTYGEVLRRQGYATGYAGKWHLDGPGKPQWEPKRRFGWEDNRYMFNRGHWKNLTIEKDGPRVGAMNKNGGPDYALAGADEESFTTDFLTNRTIEFIREHSHEEFAYHVCIPDPHGPNTVRAPYDTMYTDLEFELPKSASAGHDLPEYAATKPYKFNPKILSQYFGMVKCIDDNIGRIIETLREEGVLENTIIVFTSDHGDLLGEHGRDNKGVPMEGSARIPFIMHAPGIVTPGTIVHEPFGTVDFKPTLLALMGVEDLSANEGRDYSAFFTAGEIPTDWEHLTFIRNGGHTLTAAGEYTPDNGWIGAFGSRYKLVFASNAAPVLFDLYEDPHELTNLIDSPAHRHIVREFAQSLENYAESNQEPHLDSLQVQADFAWALSDQVAYSN